jgi:hypothetical protein
MASPCGLWSPDAHAQEAAVQPTFKVEELDQLLAPIALYPDELLTNVLVASTYPLEVVQAARWRKEPANARLKGDPLVKALERQDWDPSVKALVQVPDILQTMNEKLDWTQKLGDAFLAQEDQVMERIQYLRKKADEAGNLKSNEQQKVVKQTEYIIIQPAKPDVIYVPVYQPTVVYGSWWYPSYPPYYWYWGRPASAFVSGFFWGAGFALAGEVWGWGNVNWGRGDIDIDINRYNQINVNRPQINSSKWVHDPKHRKAVPYRDNVSREKYGKLDKANIDRDKFKGRDTDAMRDRVSEKLGDGGGQKLKDKAGDRGPAAKDKVGDKAANRLPDTKDKLAGREPAIKDKAGDKQPVTKDKVQANLPSKSKDIARPADRPKPTHKAMDVRPKADVAKHVDRGNLSRKSAASHPNISRGGGGRPGGGHGGGGRRR